MIGALIILLITISVGLLLYVYDLKWRRSHPVNPVDPEKTDAAPEEEKSDSTNHHGEICCGRHLVCEKSLTPSPGEEIVYYEDEDLDRFADMDESQYTDDDIEEIREVMTTLLPDDIPGWVRSIQLRRITLPTVLRDELFLLLSDCS